MIKKSKRLLVKFPLLLSDFNQTDICLAEFKKKKIIGYQISIKPYSGSQVVP
jgi:hypothetical protein